MRVIPVDKPLGVTSHDVVARARRSLQTRRVGHAGTLDPLATGVLVLLEGEATKLSPYLTAARKSYLAWVALGGGTPTLDAEGPVIERASSIALTGLASESIVAAAAAFLGVTEQRPPAFSAIKRVGERSYAAARRGEATEPPARPARYHSVRLLAFADSRKELPSTFAPGTDGWRQAAGGVSFDLPEELEQFPTALFSLEVAAGTYVRSFARDLGEALGVPAHLSGLVRTSSGGIGLTSCVQLADVASHEGVPLREALPFPALTLDDATARAVRDGKRVALPVAGTTALFDEGGGLVAMVEPRAEEQERVDPGAAGDAGDASSTDDSGEMGKTGDASDTSVPVRILRAWRAEAP